MKQIRIPVVLLAVLALSGANAATLRVNNVPSSGAQFTNVEEALEAASDGDVIILDASSESYGDFTIGKTITLKGTGYYLDTNGITKEGPASSKVGNIKITVPGVTITGLECHNISLGAGANSVVITRNAVNFIELGGTFGYDITEENAISGTIIHQNILNGIGGPAYGAKAVNTQITNNIIRYSYGNSTPIGRLRNAVIRYNTYGSGEDCAFRWVENSVFEHNLGGKPESTEGSQNSFVDNVSEASPKVYGDTYFQTEFEDSIYKEVDATLSTEHGAFAGETPYVLSGVPAGPVILDVELPNAVVKGEDLNVTVTIGMQK